MVSENSIRTGDTLYVSRVRYSLDGPWLYLSVLGQPSSNVKDALKGSRQLFADTFSLAERIGSHAAWASRECSTELLPAVWAEKECSHA